MKEDVAKTRVERASLQQSVSDLIYEVRQASDELGGALRALVESLDCRSENVAVKAKVERSGVETEFVFP